MNVRTKHYLQRPVAAHLSVLLLCTAIVFAFAPGHMDADILGMLRWAKSGGYTDWYPLLLPLLAKVCVLLGIGPGAILAFQVFSVGIGAYAFMMFFWRPPVAAICTYCVLLCPAVLGYLGAITSHGLMVALLVPGYAGLLYLTRPLSFRRSSTLFSFTFLALALATISRQNAAAFTLPAFCCWFFLLARELRFFETRRVIRNGIIFLVSCAALLGTGFTGKEVLASILKPIHTEPGACFLLYDISAISLRSHHLFLDRKHFPSQNLKDLQTIFLPYDIDVLVIWGRANVPPLKWYNDPQDTADLLRIWERCVTMHPGYYITERYHLLRGLLGLDFHSPPAVPFHPGIDPNRLGFHLADPESDTAVVIYLKDFQDTFADRAFVYFILALFAVLTTLPRISVSIEVRLVLLFIVSGSFLNAAGYFFFTPSTLLRYIWPSIVINMLVSIALLTYWVQHWLRQTGPVKGSRNEAWLASEVAVQPPTSTADSVRRS